MTTPLVTRRTALKALGATAGALLPWLSADGEAAYAAIQAKKAAPVLKVLTPAQYATVEALVETIIPTDERSPGARDARVADYMDLLLSEAVPTVRDQWLAGLAALDAEASQRFASPFVKLKEAQAIALLTDISAFETAKPKAVDPALDIPRNEQPKLKAPQVDTLLGDVGRHPAERTSLETFFANTKQATIHGYYTSEIGIHKELHYKGNQILAEFVGCDTQDGKDCPHCGRKAKA
jgi:gluconate 2-dehydrogenase subunit 3-like protein